MEQKEKPNYQLRLSDFKPFIGISDYSHRNSSKLRENDDSRVTDRETLLSVYNVAVIGLSIAVGWVALKGLDSL